LKPWKCSFQNSILNQWGKYREIEKLKLRLKHTIIERIENARNKTCNTCVYLSMI